MGEFVLEEQFYSGAEVISPDPRMFSYFHGGAALTRSSSGCQVLKTVTAISYIPRLAFQSVLVLLCMFTPLML